MRNVLQDYLDEHSFRVVVKKKKNYLTYEGLQDRYAYILKSGIIKTSVISKDGREFNLRYINNLEIVSLLRDEYSEFIDALLIFAPNLHKQNFTKSTVFNFGGISIIVKTCKCMSKNTIGTV